MWSKLVRNGKFLFVPTTKHKGFIMKTLLAISLLIATSVPAFAIGSATCERTILNTVNAAIEGDEATLSHLQLKGTQERSYGDGAMGQYILISTQVALSGEVLAQVKAKRDGSGSCEIRSLKLLN
jgi:hypothetical protein